MKLTSCDKRIETTKKVKIQLREFTTLEIFAAIQTYALMCQIPNEQYNERRRVRKRVNPALNKIASLLAVESAIKD